MRLCKYFTLQEDALKTTISSDDTSAMVCVLLAGSVTTISNLDPTVVTHGVGTLLGAVDVFNAEMDDPRFEDDDYERVYERLKRYYYLLLFTTSRHYLFCTSHLISYHIISSNNRIHW